MILFLDFYLLLYYFLTFVNGLKAVICKFTISKNRSCFIISLYKRFYYLLIQ